jgi:polyhydroxyalkanoate synthesis regulator phasin
MEERDQQDASGAENEDSGGQEGRRNARDRVSDGFSRGMGMLSALKEALEETISEARDRGDLSVDRAKDAMKDAVDRARDATSDARERFDWVTQGEFAALVKRVQELESRMEGKSETESAGSGTDSGSTEPAQGQGP